MVHGIFEGGMTFKLAWFAMVFPNIGWSLLTMRIGTVLASPAVEWVGMMMAVVFSGVYIFCLISWLWALTTERIMASGKDEDFPYTVSKPEKKYKLL